MPDLDELSGIPRRTAPMSPDEMLRNVRAWKAVLTRKQGIADV